MASIGQRLRYLFTGKPPTATTQDGALQPMRQRIDSASSSDENRKHWANADHLSADASYNPSVRFTLRNRSRYEVLNNCYAKGVVRGSADDLVGTGPRLRLTIPGDTDGEIAKIIERSFRKWSDETKLPIKLRIAHKSYERDGGCFGVFDSNERLRHPVKFDTRWMEADQCATPLEFLGDPFVTDGVRFDRMSNPVEYFFLKQHPGSLVFASMLPLQFITVPAENVIHWYCQDRFGQHREIPELTPALPLYSQVRRYTLATLTAAEFAAMIAGVMKTKATPEWGQQDDAPDVKILELVRGALLQLPDGWDASQFNATQPTTTYGDFKREILNESGRATQSPLNLVTGNSSGYNYSSGRLDHVPYQRSKRIQRNDLRLVGLDRILQDGWYPEALLVGVIPPEAPPIDDWSWLWGWDGFDSIDPYKDAQTDDLRLSDGTATHAEIYDEHNEDWRDKFDQIAVAKAYAEKKGIPWPMGAQTVVSGEKKGTPPPDGQAAAQIRQAMEEAGASQRIVDQAVELLQPAIAYTSRFTRNGKH